VCQLQFNSVISKVALSIPNQNSLFHSVILLTRVITIDFKYSDRVFRVWDCLDFYQRVSPVGNRVLPDEWNGVTEVEPPAGDRDQEKFGNGS
jgi:hypothetical protein